MRAVFAWFREPGRGAALIVLVLAALTYAADPFLLREQRVRGFDAMQRLWPRAVEQPEVMIVDIDEDSLKQFGQWPWPRTLIADLVDRIAACKPRVLGIDIIFAEPDRLSAPQIPNFVPNLPASVVAALAELPSSDVRLAQAIRAVPTVLGAAPAMAPAAPIAAPGQHRVSPILQKGGSPNRFLTLHRSMIRSLPEIAAAARSEASVDVEPDDDGTIRKVPLVALVDGNLVPSLALEMIRVAAQLPGIVVTSGPAGIDDVALGSARMPTDADGDAYLHFAPILDRYVSATQLLGPDFDSRRLEGRIVLLAVTGLGLVDQKSTPLGPRHGSDIHAQLIESILAEGLLHRSLASFRIELSLILVAGLLVIGVLRYQRPLVATAGMLGIGLLLVGTETVLFRVAGWLLDALYATEVGLAEFAIMLGGSFIAEQRERRRIGAELERQRQAEARLDGEFAAARAIQMGLLPLHFPAFPALSEIDLYARIVPAREVGGDLFDFQLIDRTHLFFMIGDVSGKGLPAALFMAMTKEMIRDAAARRGATPDQVLAEANVKIGAASNNMAEEGANMMFVTAFAGLLDLTSGELVYASAGHDSPLVIMAGRQPRELATEGGPPLGTIDDFVFPLSRDRLEAGAMLLLYTDGVTEAQNAAGAFYTGHRLNECLAGAAPRDARAVIEIVFEDLHRFVGAAEPADDITVLGVHWLAASG